MPQSLLRLIKRCAEYLPAEEVDHLPESLRGIYVLYKYRPQLQRYDVVYVGMTTAGLRRRLRSHRRKKGGLWTHWSAYEVWDNVHDYEIQELEGLLRHIYRRDSKANRLNVQRGYKWLNQLRDDDVAEWDRY
jgi:hypothetical protein